MSTIAIRDAVILWNGNSSDVGVTTHDHGVSRYEREAGHGFECSNGDCTLEWADATNARRLDIMVRVFTEMIDDGVEPAAALRAFNVIPEWQNAYSNRQRLQQAVMKARGLSTMAEVDNE